MDIENLIEYWKKILPKKVDYADLICAPAFAYGCRYVYEDEYGYMVEDTIKALEMISEIDRLYQAKCEEVTALRKDLETQRYLHDFWLNSADDARTKLDAANTKLREYEQKFADGRMVELPCNIRDTVWCINKNNPNPYTATVKYFYILEDEIAFVNEAEDSDYIFGKTAFIKKEDAEEVLK